MYKINQSLVEQMSTNKSVVVIASRPIFPVLEEQEAAPEAEEPAAAVADPKEEAKRIIEAAQKKAEKLKKTAKQDGYKDGYKEGKAKGEQELAELITNQTEKGRIVFTSLEKYKQNLYNELHDNVLQLAMDIAEKIVNSELQRDDKVYIGIVKKAIHELMGSDKFVLRVGQSDYERFFKNGPQWLQDETGCAPFEVVCDMQMGEGGCILESSDKVVNASTQIQLSRIKHMLDEKAEHDVRVV